MQAVHQTEKKMRTRIIDLNERRLLYLSIPTFYKPCHGSGGKY